MANKGGNTTTTQQVDPGTQQYVDAIRRRAIGMTGGGQYGGGGGYRSFGNTITGGRVGNSGAGPGAAVSAMSDPGDPYVQQAIGNYGQFANLGMTGANAMAGDPSAVAQMMNPYNATLNPYWDQMRQQTLGTIGQQATQANAYGGSRHGVAEGQGLADIANMQAGQRYGEFGNAMGRAGQLANLGFGANQGLFQAGDYLRTRDIDLLNRAMGPHGTSQTQPTQGAGLLGLLGGGLSLASGLGWQPFAPGA
jgi:hypothetical protein